MNDTYEIFHQLDFEYDVQLFTVSNMFFLKNSFIFRNKIEQNLKKIYGFFIIVQS